MPRFKVRAFLGDVSWEIEADDEDAAVEQASRELLDGGDKLEEVLDLASWETELIVPVCQCHPEPMGANPSCKVHGLKGDSQDVPDHRILRRKL